MLIELLVVGAFLNGRELVETKMTMVLEVFVARKLCMKEMFWLEKIPFIAKGSLRHKSLVVELVVPPCGLNPLGRRTLCNRGVLSPFREFFTTIEPVIVELVTAEEPLAS